MAEAEAEAAKVKAAEEERRKREEAQAEERRKEAEEERRKMEEEEQRSKAATAAAASSDEKKPAGLRRAPMSTEKYGKRMPMSKQEYLSLSNPLRVGLKSNFVVINFDGSQNLLRSEIGG